MGEELKREKKKYIIRVLNKYQSNEVAEVDQNEELMKIKKQMLQYECQIAALLHQKYKNDNSIGILHKCMKSDELYSGFQEIINYETMVEESLQMEINKLKNDLYLK